MIESESVHSPPPKCLRMKMKCLLLTLILVFHAAMGAGALAQDEAGRYVVSRDTPDWFKASFLDFGEDVAEAAAADKRVMIYFGQDGCPYCKKLHEDSFKNPETVRFITSRFDSVAVNMFGDLEAVWTDGDDSFSEKTLSAKLGIQFTPTLLFLDEEGMEVARVAGYQPPERLRAVLDYVAGKMERQGVSLEFHMREQARKSAGQPALIPDSFARANGGLNHPGKRTAVLISQGGCAICAEWRDYFFANASDWAARFHLVGVDRFGSAAATETLSESEWAKAMNVTFVPALIFLNPDGSEFFRVDGYLRAFHLDSTLDYAAAGAAKTEPEFQRFLRHRADEMRDAGKEVKIW